MGPGKNRDWGYASSDDEGNLSYTSYEKDGSVNRYSDRGDNHHSHEHWDSKDDYNSGDKPDSSRYEKGNTSNPSTGEVQNNGGCYLTSACMQHFKEEFDDNCYELKVLRWFRDNYVSVEDKEHYYMTSPIIVSAINEIPKNIMIYDYIYDNVVDTCVRSIENGEYNEAYKTYKNSILSFEEQFARPVLKSRLIKSLKQNINF